jgi:xanthine/uracil/vitamin C permease (AzgA family)
MGTMHRTLDRPLTLRIPHVRPLPRVVGESRMARLVLATAAIAVLGGICMGFIVGYAVAIAMQVGP